MSSSVASPPVIGVLGGSGVYDIEVKNEADELIAVFRGRSSRIKGHFFDEGA